MNNDVWLAISNVSGIGATTIAKLYNNFPDLTKENYIEKIKYMNFEKIVVKKKPQSLLLDNDYMNNKIQDAVSQIAMYKEKGIEVITLADNRYPEVLRIIKNPPAVLYCKGNTSLLKENKHIAVIGTRNATEKGMNAAGKVAAAFSNLDYVIVSGLAIGIDTGAHLGALESGGHTIAVLAGGVDDKSIYPKENVDLAKRIVNNLGLLVSEYKPGTRPNRSTFVSRDRIQSGLSIGVCPVQTDVKGGTQHTIKYAFEQKRIVFCPVPSEQNHENMDVYKGIHQLIDEKNVNVINNKDDYEIIDKILMGKLRELQQKNDSSSLKEVDDFPVDKSEDSQLEMFENHETIFLDEEPIDEISKKALQYIEMCHKNNIDLDESIHIIKQMWRS